PPLAGDDFISITGAAHRSHRNGLNDAAFLDRARQLIKLRTGKIAAWIARIGAKKLDRHPALAAYALGGGGGAVAFRSHVTDQGCQAPPQARPRRLFRHGGFSREIVHAACLTTSNLLSLRWDRGRLARCRPNRLTGEAWLDDDAGGTPAVPGLHQFGE